MHWVLSDRFWTPRSLRLLQLETSPSSMPPKCCSSCPMLQYALKFKQMRSIAAELKDTKDHKKSPRHSIVEKPATLLLHKDKIVFGILQGEK